MNGTDFLADSVGARTVNTLNINPTLISEGNVDKSGSELMISQKPSTVNFLSAS